MASLTWWTWVWVISGSWWWTGRPGVLWFMGLQRVRHDCDWTDLTDNIKLVGHIEWIWYKLSIVNPSIFPSMRFFSNESALCIRWPKYWSFSYSISSSKEYSGLTAFRIDWLDLLAVQGTLKILLQHHSSPLAILNSWKNNRTSLSKNIAQDLGSIQDVYLSQGSSSVFSHIGVILLSFWFAFLFIIYFFI